MASTTSKPIKADNDASMQQQQQQRQTPTTAADDCGTEKHAGVVNEDSGSRDCVDHCANVYNATNQSVKAPPSETIVAVVVTPERRKSSFSTLDKLPPLFQQFRRKRGGSAPAIHSISTTTADTTITSTATLPKNATRRPPFVKSSSIARLFGNTYSTSSAASLIASVQASSKESPTTTETSTKTTSSSNTSASSQPIVERFQACSEEDQHNSFLNETDDSNATMANGGGGGLGNGTGDGGGEFGAADASNPFRSLSRGLGRLFFKKSYSVKISDPDPEFKVAYLGNVLTGWAKGESCMEKPLATLWRNYTQNCKPDVSMRVRICPSGLKATTRQHGLTEYWSHRITFCSAPRNYPKVFCWIYRHEGRKLKHELRCHAVLCTKDTVAESIAKTLQDNLCRALREFKRDKVNKQNARLSLVNSVYENPSMPQRKIMLSVGGNNYRPPLERSKSAPRLMVIEETGEEPDEETDAAADGDDDADRLAGRKSSAAYALIPRSSSRPACCTVDPLYPAMTLGRRKCRRGHSIRRTGNRHAVTSAAANQQRASALRSATLPNKAVAVVSSACNVVRFSEQVVEIVGERTEEHAAQQTTTVKIEDRLHDSGDELDKLLLSSDYENSATPLADELLSYFDMKFKSNSTTAATTTTTTMMVVGSMIDLHRRHDGADDDDDDDGIAGQRAASVGDETDDDDETVELRLHSSRFEAVRTSRRFATPVRQSLSLDNLDAYRDCDAEEDYDDDDDDEEEEEEASAPYFSQADILSTMQRLSTSHHAHQDSGYAAGEPAAADEFNDEPNSLQHHHHHHHPHHLHNHHRHHHRPDMVPANSLDSDEGSISSGFETVSTATANGSNSGASAIKSDGDDAENADMTSLACSSVRTTPLVMCKQPQLHQQQQQLQPQLQQPNNGSSKLQHADSFSDDSEHSDVSDESGYVEYQRLARQASAAPSTTMAAPVAPVAAPRITATGIGRITIDLVDIRIS